MHESTLLSAGCAISFIAASGAYAYLRAAFVSRSHKAVTRRRVTTTLDTPRRAA
jgi:hypothetical protein